ncbi:hypothetical protein [Azospirillum sp.]|uniref:hypothetical protein n=1 Tax=Azospirillum sp. TaxID=34012 RepID=UPI002D348974|nr:hypothetical protein [Azospirillum sp.]HYD64419.1 hypothetical protein [Azospirillum sp.]
MSITRKALIPALGLAAGLLCAAAPAAADSMTCSPMTLNMRCSITYTGSPKIGTLRVESATNLKLSVQHSIRYGRCDSPVTTSSVTTPLAPKGAFLVSLPPANGTSATLTACASVTFYCADETNGGVAQCMDVLRVTAY